MSARPTRFGQLTRMSSSILSNRVVYRHPVVMMHAVTEACNARCGFCVFRHGKRRPDELSVAEIAALYTEARAVGLQYVHLWGGEPLVHPHIGDIAREAHEAGLIIGMVTNGSLLVRRGPDVAPYLSRLYVSVDHPTDTHDALRGVPGLFASILDGVTAMRRLRPNLPIVFSLTLGRDNADAMQQMADLCRDLSVYLYVNPMRGASVAEAGDADDDRNQDVFAVDNSTRVLSWEAQRPVWDLLIDLKRRGWPIQNTQHYMRQIRRTAAAPRFRCHWPKLCLGVEANGDIVDCQDWASPIGNARETPLRELMQHPRMRELRGPTGVRCNACVTPGRVEPSRFWGLNPAVTSGALRTMVLRRMRPRGL